MLTEKDLYKNPVFQLLEKLQINPKEYVIMGSPIMFVLGIREISTLEDLDLFVTTDA